MSINPVSNLYYNSKEKIELNLVSILDEDRFGLFKKICSYLKPLDMQAFLSTCKTLRMTHKNFEENHEIGHKALMTRIFF